MVGFPTREMFPKAFGDSSSLLVAKALKGSWRSEPPPLEISEAEFDRVAPLLLGSGTAALGWWRLKHSGLRPNSYHDFRQAYRLLALQDSIHESEIKRTFSLLRSAGVEPLLLKGWAIARSYPETVLRPFGDVDVAVAPSEQRLARRVLESPEGKGLWFDLHDRLDELPDRSFEELFERSQLVKLGDCDVRVMSEEDHLALLSIHLLKHGAWRPLWLCDIGVALETREASFDWEICLGRNRRRATWITCAIGLARELLGAEIRDDEIEERARKLPRWLIPSVLKRWETPFASMQPPMSHSAPIASYLRQPKGFLSDLRNRWPDPILATISLRGPFNNLPRFPFQVGNCIARAAQFLARLPVSLRQQ